MKRAFSDKSLKEVITEMLRQNGLENKFTELDIEQHYRAVVGDYISRKTREARLRGKTLVVRIESGPVKEELNFQKTALIAAINERIGRAVIDEIQIW